jgi:hypothetical protein
MLGSHISATSQPHINHISATTLSTSHRPNQPVA